MAVVNSLLILLILTYLTALHINRSEGCSIRYVDNVRLFNEFGMSKDMNTIHTDRIKKQITIVDSLYKNFQINIKNKEKEMILKKAQLNFQKENQRLQEMQEYFSKDVSKQVWDRLNLYIKDYGVQHGYQIIFGTQGNGNIMYADSIINITDDLLEYCNTKYEGIKE